jgi:hypothetical protein
MSVSSGAIEHQLPRKQTVSSLLPGTSLSEGDIKFTPSGGDVDVNGRLNTTSLSVSGLSASSLVATDSQKTLTSLPTSTYLTPAGVSSSTLTVTPGTGTCTLTLPQSIGTTSDVKFSALTAHNLIAENSNTSLSNTITTQLDGTLNIGSGAAAAVRLGSSQYASTGFLKTNSFGILNVDGKNYVESGSTPTFNGVALGSGSVAFSNSGNTASMNLDATGIVNFSSNVGQFDFEPVTTTSVPKKINLFDNGNTDSRFCGFGIDIAGAIFHQRMTSSGWHMVWGSGVNASPLELMRLSGNDLGLALGTTAYSRKLTVNSSTGNCMRLQHNSSSGTATNFTDFSVDSGGVLRIEPSGFHALVNGHACPNGNAAFMCGTSGLRWSNVWSVLGNFSGLLTASAGISTTGATLSGLTASSLVATDGSSALTSNIAGLSPTFTAVTATTNMAAASFLATRANGSTNPVHFCTLTDQDTGLAFIADGQVSLNTNTVARLTVTTTSIQPSLDFFPSTNGARTLGGSLNRWSNTFSVLGNFSGVVSLADGAVGTGGLNFGSDTDTGIHRIAADNIGLSCGNSLLLDCKSTGITKPLQPSFHALRSATLTDQTGDGTIYAIVFNSENHDAGSNYNNTTGVFTAPVTGRYFLNATVYMSGLLSAHTFAALTMWNGTIGTTPIGREICNPWACSSGGLLSMSVSTCYQLSATNTVSVTLQVSNGTKVVDIELGFTSFSGNLLS